MSILIGSSVSIGCNAQTSLKDLIQYNWLRNGKFVSGYLSVLKFNFITSLDAGIYLCATSLNGVQQISANNVTVNVVGRVEINTFILLQLAYNPLRISILLLQYPEELYSFRRYIF